MQKVKLIPMQHNGMDYTIEIIEEMMNNAIAKTWDDHELELVAWEVSDKLKAIVMVFGPPMGE